MRKTLSFVLISILIFTIFATIPVVTHADDSENYSYEIIDGEAIITNISEKCKIIPSKIKGYPVTTIDIEDCEEDNGVRASNSEIIIPEGVTTIKNGAFSRCEKLEKITLPNSLSFIESSAFYDTEYYNKKSNWENGALYIGKHLIFVDKSVSGKYQVKEGTITIAEDAFLGCENITEILLPKSVKNICVNAFTNCKNLKSITVSKDNKYLSSVDGVLFNKDITKLIAAPGALSGTYTVPKSVKTIGETAFQQCVFLRKVNLPNGLEKIESYAFGWCDLLESINIPDSVTEIGSNILYNTKLQLDKGNWTDKVLYVDNHLISSDNENITGEYIVKNGTLTIAGNAFGSCVKLKKVTLPDGIKSIGDWAFSLCEELKSINLPDSITYIGDTAFHFCESLKSIKIPKKVTVIRDHTFWDCTSLESVSLPSSLKKIESYAFALCKSLKEINIPNSVTYIGNHAFTFCALEEVVIPEGVESIEQYAFYSNNLKEIIIPKNVTGIFDHAFAECSSLKKITLNKKLNFIQKYAFEDSKNITTINYKGTKSDKKEITIEDGNYYLETAIWEFIPEKSVTSKKETSSKKTISKVSSTASVLKEETTSSEITPTPSQSEKSSQHVAKPIKKQNDTLVIWIFVAVIVIGISGGFTAFWLIKRKKN